MFNLKNYREIILISSEIACYRSIKKKKANQDEILVISQKKCIDHNNITYSELLDLIGGDFLSIMDESIRMINKIIYTDKLGFQVDNMNVFEVFYDKIVKIYFYEILRIKYIIEYFKEQKQIENIIFVTNNLSKYKLISSIYPDIKINYYNHFINSIRNILNFLLFSDLKLISKYLINTFFNKKSYNFEKRNILVYYPVYRYSYPIDLLINNDKRFRKYKIYVLADENLVNDIAKIDTYDTVYFSHFVNIKSIYSYFVTSFFLKFHVIKALFTSTIQTENSMLHFLYTLIFENYYETIAYRIYKKIVFENIISIISPKLCLLGMADLPLLAPLKKFNIFSVQIPSYSAYDIYQKGFFCPDFILLYNKKDLNFLTLKNFDKDKFKLTYNYEINKYISYGNYKIESHKLTFYFIGSYSYKNIYGISPEEYYFSFSDLIECINDINLDIKLIIKPHPYEMQPNFYLRILKKTSFSNYQFTSEINYEEIAKSYLVIGNYSTLLFKAMLMKKPIICLNYNLYFKNDIFFIEKDGLLLHPFNKKELLKVLKKVIGDKQFLIKYRQKVEQYIKENIITDIKSYNTFMNFLFFNNK